MDNKSLTHKQTQSHHNYMQSHKKNLLKRRRQQLTNNTNVNEDDQSFSHLTNTNISKSLNTHESQLDESLVMLKSDDLMTKHQGIMNLRQILVNDNFNVRQKVLDSPFFDQIINFCQQDQQKHLKLEAAWCIANLSVGVSSQINFLVKKNIIKILEQVIQDPFSQIAEQGVWAIGNICSDEVKYRNLILQSNIINILKLKLENTDNEMIQKIIWVFSNICQNTSKYEKLNDQIYSLLEILKRAFVVLNNDEIKKDCIAGFQMWIKEEQCRKLILQDDFLDQFKKYYAELVQNIQENNLKISNCNNILGELTSKDDEENFKILEYRFLTEIKKVLTQGSIHLTNQSLWIIGNISLSSEKHLEMIFSENELTQIIIHCTQHKNENVVYEALWVIQNFTKANNLKHLNYILSNGLLDVLKRFMNLATDERLCLMALSCIKNLLDFFFIEQGEQNTFLLAIENNGIMDQLEELQTHESSVVYNQIIEILDQYFEHEDQLTQ